MELPSTLTRTQAIIVISVMSLIIFLVAAIYFFPNEGPNKGPVFPKNRSLIVWGTDPLDKVMPLIGAYRSFKEIPVQYQQFSPENYENAFLNAMATGQGPDVFMFHNTWINKHGDKAMVAPDTLSMVQVRKLFPDIIEKNFSYGGKMYALPLYLDNLALIYNKDIFNANGITTPPQTWNSFRNIISAITEIDENGQLVKSAAAIGGSGRSVSNAADLFSLMMFQSGMDVVDTRSGRVNLRLDGGKNFAYYLQFTNTASPYYTWNEEYGNSLDVFAAGRTAMAFAYADQLNALRKKNPYLNFRVAAMPQVNTDKPVNFADYWGLAVSAKSDVSFFAWDFVIFTTTNEQAQAAYLNMTKRPPALLTLISKYQSDPDFEVFANQALTSRSIFTKNIDRFRDALSQAIEDAVARRLSPDKAVEKAEAEINSFNTVY